MLRMDNLYHFGHGGGRLRPVHEGRWLWTTRRVSRSIWFGVTLNKVDVQWGAKPMDEYGPSFLRWKRWVLRGQ